MLEEPGLIDIQSKEFTSLPAEVKYELLVAMKDAQRKKRKRKYIEGDGSTQTESTLPEVIIIASLYEY